jgi:hypothetical protein
MRVRLASLVLLTSLVPAITACSGSDGSDGSADSPDSAQTDVLRSPTPSPTETIPPPKPPHVHTCYRLTYDDALAPTHDRKPESCTGPHTGLTFFVGRYDKALPVDGDEVHQLESTACQRRFASFVGGTPEHRRLSMLRTVGFTPTVEQAAEGAHWFECVAIALRDDEDLALLQGPLEGVLDRTEGREHYGLCGTAEPGTAGFEQRICAAPHSWVALRTVPFEPGPYPGVEHVRSAGQEPCQDAGADASDDPLDYRWSYQWPTREQWRAGRTYGVCWAPA